MRLIFVGDIDLGKKNGYNIPKECHLKKFPISS